MAPISGFCPTRRAFFLGGCSELMKVCPLGETRGEILGHLEECREPTVRKHHHCESPTATCNGAPAGDENSDQEGSCKERCPPKAKVVCSRRVDMSKETGAGSPTDCGSIPRAISTRQDRATCGSYHRKAN